MGDRGLLVVVLVGCCSATSEVAFDGARICQVKYSHELYMDVMDVNEYLYFSIVESSCYDTCALLALLRI